MFLGSLEDDQPVIDVIDACCPTVLEKCYHILPPAEKAAAASNSNVDLQWIAERSSCVWTAGIYFSVQNNKSCLEVIDYAVEKDIIKILLIEFTFLT